MSDNKPDVTWAPIETCPSDRRVIVGYIALNRGIPYLYEARLSSRMPAHMGAEFMPWGYKEPPNVWIDIDVWALD